MHFLSLNHIETMETLKERQHHVHMKGMEFIWIAVWSIPMQANLVRLVYAKWNQGASYTSCTESQVSMKNTHLRLGSFRRGLWLLWIYQSSEATISPYPTC